MGKVLNTADAYDNFYNFCGSTKSETVWKYVIFFRLDLMIRWIRGAHKWF